MNARDGDRVIVKVDRWPSNNRKSPVGHIEKIISEDDLHEVRMQMILAEQGFSEIFPEQVEKEVASMKYDLNKKEISRRKDFRDVLTITIGPVDTQEFEDRKSVV